MRPTATTWQDEAGEAYPSLAGDTDADVVVIGGGLTGVLTAYLLAEVGVRAVVLESGRIGSGATAYTTAFATQVTDMTLADMERLMGPGKTGALWRSGAAAIDLLEDIVRKESVACAFRRCPAFVYGTTEKQVAHLEQGTAAAGCLGIDLSLRRDDALGFPNAGYLEVPNQALFHPLRFVRSVARAAERLGARVFENSEVTELVGTETFEARTAAGRVTAKYAVVATHVPFNKPRAVAFKKAKYKSYVLEATIPKGALREAMYVDSASPYHYSRADAGDAEDRLIVGGGDHRQDIPVSAAKSLARLERYLPSLLPAGGYRVVREWSGQLVESIDGLPYIGEYAPRQFLATAYSGNGMTYAAIAAIIVRDKVLGTPNAWAELYDPKRKQPLSLVLTNGIRYIGVFFGGAVRTTLSRGRARTDAP